MVVTPRTPPLTHRTRSSSQSISDLLLENRSNGAQQNIQQKVWLDRHESSKPNAILTQRRIASKPYPSRKSQSYKYHLGGGWEHVIGDFRNSRSAEAAYYPRHGGSVQYIPRPGECSCSTVRILGTGARRPRGISETL